MTLPWKDHILVMATDSQLDMDIVSIILNLCPTLNLHPTLNLPPNKHTSSFTSLCRAWDQKRNHPNSTAGLFLQYFWPDSKEKLPRISGEILFLSHFQSQINRTKERFV
ncbi:hypothetical protein KIL84_006338 [Mauremys mutica]|uniref:Uncharacterized protein n=1 Tax=Mauremys mutica TaxID=74926 RepID=A0A9D3X191_9SAUR|nr:hypothetical protein KIL84_006338 [Mauremys mutica]